MVTDSTAEDVQVMHTVCYIDKDAQGCQETQYTARNEGRKLVEGEVLATALGVSDH